LWAQSESGQQCAYSSQAKADVKPPLDEACDDWSRPQAKIQPILSWIAAVDPNEKPDAHGAV
jgi:hypothetical protein